MTVPRRLVVVFESPFAEALLRLGVEVGFHSVLVEPDPTNLLGPPKEHGDRFVSDLSAAVLDEHTDVVFTDHDRPELGAMLPEALAQTTRWIGVVGGMRNVGALGVADADTVRVHQPIGLNIGGRTPAEIAVATLAGLIADRNHKPGGFEFLPDA